MSALDCSIEGCENPGVIQSTAEGEQDTWRCFEHAGIVAGETPQVAQEAAPVFLADIANRFAAELLEAASVAMGGDEATIDAVLASLVEETGFETSVIAGIQLALSMVIAMGSIPAVDVLTMSETLRQNAADAEWQDQEAPPLADEVSPVLAGLGSDESPEAGADAAHVCDVCNGTGVYEFDGPGTPPWICTKCDGTGYLPEPTGDDLPISDEGEGDSE